MPDQTFRFRGHHRPTGDVRASILAPKTLAPGVVEMRLYDPIDSWGGEWGVSAKEFADSLAALPENTTEIRLHVNSPGGEVWEGIAITNQLRNHRARVVAVVDGLAASAASVIAVAADETIMGRNSQLMIHDAWGLCVGNRDDMHSTAARLDTISDNLASVYAEKAGGDVVAWRSAMLAETWYSADEAVAQGLADSVEAAPERADAASFDLSMFQHAGRQDAPDPVLVAVAPANPPAEPTPPQQPETDAAAVREFQRAHGITVDGVPGPQTVAAGYSPNGDAPSGPSALQQRRHQMNRRRAEGRAPVAARP